MRQNDPTKVAGEEGTFPLRKLHHSFPRNWVKGSGGGLVSEADDLIVSAGRDLT